MPQSHEFTATAFCPRCNSDVRFTLHNEKVVQKKRIAIKPILPTCLACGTEVRVHPRPASMQGGNLLVLIGTCASGKSTTAEMLIQRHGFYGIDGNVVSNVVSYKSGGARVEFNSVEILQEIGYEIDILLALQQDIVLTQVIIPEDLPSYRELFRSRGLHYRIFVLQPQYSVAVARSKARTCWNTLTEERWIKHFHEHMARFVPQQDVVIFDNSDLSAEEAAERIWQLYRQQEA